MIYYKYSDYLKAYFGEKVYKIPVHLKGTCPNRDGKVASGGCIFCGEVGAGFEMLSPNLPAREQLEENISYIGEKYGAKKYIAYFQNFTGTYMPLSDFIEHVEQVLIENVVGISISTRPDCIEADYLEYLKTVKERGISVEFELGLQSVNPTTLKILNRGHTLTDFLKAAQKIKDAGFTLCVHLIGNLPWDSDEDFYEAARLLSYIKADGVKIHSLYILKNTVLGDWYLSDQVKIMGPEAYRARVIQFLRLLSPEITVQRLFGRAPKEETLFCNWGTSWRKLHNDLEAEMIRQGVKQGDLYRRLL